MRRIYESEALYRDDDEPGAPRERSTDDGPQAMRTVPSGTLSRLLVPHWLRRRAIAVSVDAPSEPFAPGERIPFTVELRNRLPIPITLPVASPVPWTWAVDGEPSAGRNRAARAPEEPKGFAFDRGERKRFERRWSGRFKVGPREWEQAAPGEHTISVAVNTEGDPGRLTDDVTVLVRE